MKRVSVLAAFVMTAAAFVAGCSGETGGSSETGSVSVNLIIGNTNVTAVSFEVVCESGVTLNGQFNVNDEQDPPVWAAIMDLPEGPCKVTLTAFDNAGAPLCTGSADFTVVVNETVKVNIVLTCLGDGQELLGTVDIDATFEEVPANNCPRLYFLNVVPDEVPPEGSTVTVLVGDADGDPVSTALTATGGSFVDPSAQLTTYTCDDANGTQTVSVIASDGDPACDKTKSFDVTCPGVNLCENVDCDDGNPCTDDSCNPETGECETSNNTNACDAGPELTTNGDFETGNLDGWTQFCTGPNNGTCEATMAQANGGSWSGNVATAGAPANPLIKQANIGIGIVTPNSPISISFDLFGSLEGAGGVVFAELFGEIAGGGTSSSEILGGNPLFPSDTWTTYSFETTTGPDVSGGVTLQLAAICGAEPGCAVNAYFDNVSVTFGPGGAGTCNEGLCVPNPECTVPADCPATGNECIDPVCNAGTCETSNNTDLCDGGNGTCDGQGNCVPNAECTVDGDCPATGNECIDPVCNAGTCETSNNTNACENDTGTCSAGFCVPAPTANAFIKTLDPLAGFSVSASNTQDTTNLPDSWGGFTLPLVITQDLVGHILQFGFQTNASNFDSSGNFYDNVVLNDPAVLYTQDFNGLDINGTVIGDGWTFFVNVFDSAGTRKFGYGGAAPNGPQICALVTGEGGVGQEPQQLSVYSDYNCCGLGTGNEEGHGNVTDLVETNVFQERTIAAEDVGKTFEFAFQAKGGNIGQ
ncbi:MAG: hypothetical protein OES69_04010 [Myxococcales bacterium]|nr:hypothetical protein [Myxococcales bacterium]MDH3843077.1 hypothetical protein [Myxococcales bacterium]